MRIEVKIEHMIWTLDHDDESAWFKLRAENQKQILFSGPIHKGMARQVLNLHRKIRDIEPKICERCSECDGSGWIEVERMVRVSGEYNDYEPVGEKERCENCNPLGV